MKKQVNIKIFGLVQGVLFRSSAKTQAELLNITGYVKNNWDETVEILACGEEENLKKLIAWASHGPADARVDKVEVKWQKSSGNFLGFEVRY
ncbi:MAG: acylphosphatase [Patescibacteria group bacterium]